MKEKNRILIYSFIIMGAVLMFASSCKKDENNNNNSATSLTDSRDGIVYKIVTIGEQVWMAENLKYLPSVVGSSTGSDTEPYYYVNGYNGIDVVTAKATANYTAYGVLYNWTAAMNGAASALNNPSGVKGVCPNGWHLPSDGEWDELSTFIVYSSYAGGRLKETGFTHWASPNTGATNQYGYTALPGGMRHYDGTFDGISLYGCWWSASASGTSTAYYRSIFSDSEELHNPSFGKTNGFSVRCLKD